MMLALCVGTSSAAASTTFHVAVDGDGLGLGTLDSPFASLSRSADASAPGDQILVRDGVHSIGQSLRLRQNGLPEPKDVGHRARPDAV